MPWIRFHHHTYNNASRKHSLHRALEIKHSIVSVARALLREEDGWGGVKNYIPLRSRRHCTPQLSLAHDVQAEPMTKHCKLTHSVDNVETNGSDSQASTGCSFGGF